MEIATEDHWFKTETVDDGVTYIHEPYIKPFYRCNIWHVKGRDRDLLVDSGMGVVSLRQQIPILTDRPCIAVASHTHFDHIGGHHEFDERWVHQDEADILATPTRASTVADPYVSDDIFSKLPPPPYASARYSVRSAPATRLLAHHDIIDLGDRHFQVIHTPGHSPGGIALWEADSGILFSGDTVYDGPLVDDVYHSDPAAYVETLRGLLELPVRIVHGGHFPSFDGQRYRVLIRAYLEEQGV